MNYMRKTVATLMVAGLTFSSLGGFAFAAEQTNPSTKNASGSGQSSTQTSKPVKQKTFEEYVNSLTKLTKEEKKKLITARKNKDTATEQKLLKKAGVDPKSQPVQETPSGGKKQTNGGGAAATAVDFVDYVNGLKQLTKEEKSKLITAYKDNKMDTVAELLEKAGMISVQPAAAVPPGNSKSKN